MPDSEFKTDHDMIVTLVANMKELRTKQIENHEEIKEQILELKNNYAHRLDLIETKVQDLIIQKFSNVDWATFRNDDYIPSYEKLGTRVTWLERIAYGSVGALAILELYFRYFR